MKRAAVINLNLTLALTLTLLTRVAVDMKYHIHIHIHIHIHRCLSCVHVYAVSNYKKHSCFLLSTGSILLHFYCIYD